MDAIHDVLEIGCGIGATSASLTDSYGMNVQGTDLDPEQIKLVRTTQPTSERLHFAVEDATHLTFEDASFDLVLSQDISRHIPDWEQVVQEYGDIADLLETIRDWGVEQVHFADAGSLDPFPPLLRMPRP